MNLEIEFCRKAHDHHTVLKSELSAVLLEQCTKAGLNRDAAATVCNAVNAAVDGSTHKMVLDIQKTLRNAK